MNATLQDAERRVRDATKAELQAFLRLQEAAHLPPSHPMRTLTLKFAAVQYAAARSRLVQACDALFDFIERRHSDESAP